MIVSKHGLRHKYLTAVLSGLLFFAVNAYAETSNNNLYIQTSLFTQHYKPKDDHNNNQKLVNLEYRNGDDELYGIALFQNSFDQFTQYLYYGRQWPIQSINENLYFSLTGGLIHGYKGEEKNEIPLNDLGVAPAILPIFGYRYQRIETQVILFGLAGYTLTLGFNIPIH